MILACPVFYNIFSRFLSSKLMFLRNFFFGIFLFRDSFFRDFFRDFCFQDLCFRALDIIPRMSYEKKERIVMYSERTEQYCSKVHIYEKEERKTYG
jgi:hypothetical protein